MSDKLRVNGQPVKCLACDEWIDISNICATHLDFKCSNCCGCQ